MCKMAAPRLSDAGPPLDYQVKDWAIDGRRNLLNPGRVLATGEPVLFEPPCAAVNCPIHRNEAPGRQPQRRGLTRKAFSPRERRSKLEVANERNRKLLAARGS